MYLILLKLEQSAFTQASFASLYDVHKYSGGFQMVSCSLSKQTADCESQLDWLMSVSMYLATFCDTWK